MEKLLCEREIEREIENVNKITVNLCKMDR
jgi:hypothetical protein